MGKNPKTETFANLISHLINEKYIIKCKNYYKTIKFTQIIRPSYIRHWDHKAKPHTNKTVNNRPSVNKLFL